MKAEIRIGYSFEKICKFSVKELKDMALRCGDMNSIHHDVKVAKKTKFGDLIASGSSITAYFSALIPTHFMKISQIVGLEMSQRFKAPIYPNTKLKMKWEIESIQTKTNNDYIVELSGTIIDEKNITCVLATATILLTEKL